MTYDSRPDTEKHIARVRQLLMQVEQRLHHRAIVHDASKLLSPEKEMFDEYTPKLAEVEYGSDEYTAAIAAMGEALEHHYAHNSHHPEHFENGIWGMSLLDLIEMLVDWQAASERHRKPMPAAPGRPEAPEYVTNIERSIVLNQRRFRYGDEVRAILVNTARELRLGWV
jgi:hypothetical protein